MKHPCSPLALAALCALAPTASAHDGPPYAILVDEVLGGQSVSIWADPDVGVGTFYVYLEPAPPIDELPVLDITVGPVDEHVAKATFTAVPSEPGEPFQLVGEVDFDRRGDWDATFSFTGESGAGEISLPIDVTPPGLGKLDVLWYLSPFLALGFLWVKVFLKRREYARESAPC